MLIKQIVCIQLFAAGRSPVLSLSKRAYRSCDKIAFLSDTNIGEHSTFLALCAAHKRLSVKIKNNNKWNK